MEVDDDFKSSKPVAKHHKRWFLQINITMKS
jgi:hypothetical protein